MSEPVNQSLQGNLNKKDCIAFERAREELSIAKNTLNAYLNTLNVTKHRFPFDKRVYITRADFERVKAFVEEIRS